MKDNLSNWGLLTAVLMACLFMMCSPTLSSRYAVSDDFVLAKGDEPLDQTRRRSSCDTNEYYAPDTLHLDHTPIREIKCNFHFMNSTDKSNNMPTEEQYQYVRDLIWVLNKSLEKNMKMFLPRENNTPSLPIRYRYKLWPNPADPNDNGVHEHLDDELYYFVKSGKYRNNYDRKVIKKYVVQDGEVMNIFIMPHHPDSVASNKYRADASGIALGSNLKVSGQWKKKPDLWGIRGIFHHEIGHVLGLSHTWNANDGCDDTPKNANCYNWSTSAPCDSFASNNVMDYNAHQAAWSPCQLGKIFKNFARENSRQRKILKEDWCSFDAKKSIRITDKVIWYGAKDFSGNIYIEDGASLTVKCRLSMPENGKIIIAPKGILILDGARLHNACDQLWSGIEIKQLGRDKGTILVASAYTIENAKNTIPAAQ